MSFTLLSRHNLFAPSSQREERFQTHSRIYGVRSKTNALFVSGQGKFRYGPGMRQTYTYSVDVRSLFNGTSKNESRIYIEGQAYLNFLSSCDGFLTLSDFKLGEKPTEDWETEGHVNGEKFAQAISEYGLRFSFNDGVISEVCPADEEPAWALNFKKGLLSMIHNTMKRFDLDHETEEDDVRGSCKTAYRIKGVNGTSLIIEKDKNLHSCRGRSSLESFVQSIPYNFRPVSIMTLLTINRSIPGVKTLILFFLMSPS